MSCILTLPRVEKQLGPAVQANSYFEAYTDWIPFTGIESARFVLSLQKKHGAIQAQPAWQAAEIRTDDPNTDIKSIGSAVTTVTRKQYTQDFSGTGTQRSQKNVWVRFGVWYSSTNSAKVYGQVALDITILTKGRIAGGFSNKALATFDDGGSSTSKFENITDWLPAQEVDYAKMALILNVNSAPNVRFALAYRTAEDDRASPGGWTTVGTLTAFGESHLERLVADTDLTNALAGKMWVQFALEYASGDVSGESPGTLVASALVAVRQVYGGTA